MSMTILTLHFSLLLLFVVPDCPVSLHNKEELLPDERTIFVAYDLAIPSHLVRDALYLHQEVDVLSDDDRALWPKDSVHFQQDVLHLTSCKHRRKLSD
jgi:hypothetical protein